PPSTGRSWRFIWSICGDRANDPRTIDITPDVGRDLDGGGGRGSARRRRQRAPALRGGDFAARMRPACPAERRQRSACRVHGGEIGLRAATIRQRTTGHFMDTIAADMPPLRKDLNRHLSPAAAFAWLAAGWRDLFTQPAPSLIYGLFVFLISAAIVYGLF